MEIAKSIAPICLAIIMFGLGLGLTAQDFLRVLKNAKDLLKYLDKSRCHAILKTGINKGCQCTKKFKDPKIPYCTRHLKYFKNE